MSRTPDTPTRIENRRKGSFEFVLSVAYTPNRNKGKLYEGEWKGAVTKEMVVCKRTRL